MFRAFFEQTMAPQAYGGAVVIVVFLIAQLGVALRINHLNKTFYDIWSDPGRHDLQEAYAALMPFVLTGCLLVLVNTLASYVTSKFVFWWREAVTFHYLALARTQQRRSKVPANASRKMSRGLPKSWKPSL